MAKRYKNREHLMWVKTLPCLINSQDCEGVTAAHHLLKPYDGSRGMGMKANDRNVIPLCQYHHTLLHDTLGAEFSLFLRYGLSELTGMIVAEKLWIKSPHNPERKEYFDDLPF